MIGFGEGLAGATKGNSFHPKIKKKLPRDAASRTFAINGEICILLRRKNKSLRAAS